jgi:hypothetical protein
MGAAAGSLRIGVTFAVSSDFIAGPFIGSKTVMVVPAPISDMARNVPW